MSQGTESVKVNCMHRLFIKLTVNFNQQQGAPVIAYMASLAGRSKTGKRDLELHSTLTNTRLDEQRLLQKL